MQFLSRRKAVLALTCAVLGCRRKTQTASAPPPPIPASQPAIEEATLQIDGEPEVFPPPQLFVHPDGQSIVATLSTSQATGPAGENAMHFRMTFTDVDNPQALDGEQWHFVVPDDAAEDTPLDRIELHRRSAVLRPVSLIMTLRLPAPQRAAVDMNGMFDLFDPPDAEKPVRQVSVTGRFEAMMKTQS